MWTCKSAYSLQTRVRIHSECPVENYGTSTVFTPSYLSSLSNLNADNNAVVVPIALQEMQHLVGRGGGNIAICSSSWVSLSPLESIKVFLDSPFIPFLTLLTFSLPLVFVWDALWVVCYDFSNSDFDFNRPFERAGSRLARREFRAKFRAKTVLISNSWVG